MITAFSVSNFRSFKNSAELPVSPLTCLVGRNSSGKSSLIHALLLLRQSIEQRAIGSRVTQLNLNGGLIDAGTYEDIVNEHDAEREMSFSLTSQLVGPIPRYGLYRRMPGLVELETPQPFQGRHPVPSISSVQYLSTTENMLTRESPRVSIGFHFRPEPPFGPTLSRLDVSVDGIGKVTFRKTVGERRVQHWRAYNEGLPSKSIAIGFPRWSFFPQVEQRSARRGPKSVGHNALVKKFVALVQLGISEINAFLMGLQVLGPFRTPPARRYTFSGLGAADTGTSGERAVDLLIMERLLRSPGAGLRRGVSFWLKRLGMATSIEVKDLARRSSVYELDVRGAGVGRKANYADVGFGVSQVLPVLVQAFLVPRGGTYIVQQPEIHLHPDAQAGLADFFIYLATQGIRSIVETHSEYFLLRLRRRLAERVRPIKIGIPGERNWRQESWGKNSLSIVYVGEHDHGSQLLPLEIGDGFQFSNIPRGFMSQSVDDRMALMKALS